jgi:two-component system response regulator HydG
LGSDAISRLAAFPWPGNVRQLASSIERAVVFGVDEMVDAEQLWTPSSLDAAPSRDAQTPPWPFPADEPWTLRRLSRAYTAWTLSQTGGNKERAAEILGIDLSTLYRWQRGRQS